MRPMLPGGYFDMPRCLLDAILAAPGLSGAQLKVVLAVMRLTWGYFPEKNRAGAKIRREYLAEITGLSKRTVDKVTPLLVTEGIVEEVEPHTGRRPAILRVNPEPSLWGRFTPVGYAERRTLAVECDGQRTQGDELSSGCDRESTQGAPTGVPKVRQASHSTASPSPSSLDPSSSNPSAPPTPRDAEGRVAGGFETDPCEGISTPALQTLARRFMSRRAEVSS
jgi:Bacteriophage replication protein O